MSYITKKDPNEPVFHSTRFLPQVASLPLVMIQASQDPYVPLSTAKRLFSAAQEPKRFVVVDGRDHRFGGNRAEFFRALHEGLRWTHRASS